LTSGIYAQAYPTGTGVGIALDDFGTAFASLSYLCSFPFRKIKIDGSFVLDLPERVDCAAIIDAVAALAKRLDMSTVAEGVGSPEQIKMVVNAGREEVQDFYFSRPVPAAEAQTALSKCRLRFAAD